MDSATAIGIVADHYTDIWVTEDPKHEGRPSMRVHFGDKYVIVPLPPKHPREEPAPVGKPPPLTEEELESNRAEWLESLRNAREELMR